MRLSDRHRRIIKEMEADGYVWLSHLSVNAQMRFRWKTRKGFKGFLKVEGLTFLTERVAEAIKVGSKTKTEKGLTLTQQVARLEQQLVELEKENYKLRGVGENHEKFKWDVDKEK